MLSAKEYVEQNIDAILMDLAKLVSFKSVYQTDQAPFGSENRKALDYMLSRLEQEGYQTKNLDYYAGYGEIGQGEKLLAILGHLDVVPEGEGWNTDPYTMTIKDGIAYGRGTTDDKGGVIAGFYALNYLLSIQYPFKKRVRLVMGCNEESGFQCLEHYVKCEGHIDAGFTPDGHWPGIYGEKGIVRAKVKHAKTKIVSIQGGQAVNAVCAKVKARVKQSDLNLELFKRALSQHEIRYQIDEVDDCLELTVFGVSAHASTPDLGKNAIAYLVYALKEAEFDDEFVNFYHQQIGFSLHGENSGLDFKDHLSDLSLNIGLINKEDNGINFTVDIRFPVTLQSSVIVQQLLMAFQSEYSTIQIEQTEEPLYCDEKSPMIQAMYKAYQDVTGDQTSKMLVIGGGTYAKGIRNCIAFGPEFHSVDYHIHDANEMIPIEELKKNILIYIEAIKNLNEVDL